MMSSRDRNAKIIEAAINCFTEKGITATVSEISKKAEVPESTVYRYYKSKDEMLFYIFNYFWEELLFRIKGVLESNWEREGINKIKNLIAILQNFLDQNPDLFRVVIDIKLSSPQDIESPELKERRVEIERKKEEAISVFDEFIKEEQGLLGIKKELKPEVIRQILVGSSLALVGELYLKPGIEKKPVDIMEGIGFLLDSIKT